MDLEYQTSAMDSSPLECQLKLLEGSPGPGVHHGPGGEPRLSEHQRENICDWLNVHTTFYFSILYEKQIFRGFR